MTPTVRRAPDILDTWFQRKVISPGEYDAATRLRRMFGLVVKGGLDERGAVPPDAVTHARAALKRLLPLLGEVDKHVLVAVLCRGFTADDALRAFGQFELRNEDEVCRRVRKSLAQMHRHRWGELREVPPVDIPEIMQVMSGEGYATVKLSA